MLRKYLKNKSAAKTNLVYKYIISLSQYWPQLVDKSKSKQSRNTRDPAWIFVVDEQSFNNKKQQNVCMLQQTQPNLTPHIYYKKSKCINLHMNYPVFA